MRVHPAILAPRLSKLHYMGLIGILSLILVVTMIRGPRKVVMQAAPGIPTAEIVISSVGLETGDPLYENHLQVKTMPLDMIPDGAIRNITDLKGKFSNGLVPAGVPLLNNMLSDTRPELPESGQDLAKADMTPLDRIRASTVAVSLIFAAPPREGTRVALSIAAPNGDNIIVIDDAWVDNVDGRSATLRLNPDQALLVQTAKELGTFSFIELPTEGNSPYRGVAVQNIADLKVKLGLVKNDSDSAANTNDALSIGLLNKQEERKRFKNYAWVSGTGVRLGIAENGRLHQVDSEGYDLGELPPARMGD